MSMNIIQHIELTSSQSSITFSSIPQTGYTDLYLVVSARSTEPRTNVNIYLRPNGSTSSASARTLLGDGANVGSGTDTKVVSRDMSGANATSNTFGNASFYIPNYTSSNYKSISSDAVMENNATTSIQGITANLWSDASAISSITLVPDIGNFVQYSSATLYGILKGSLPGVTVS